MHLALLITNNYSLKDPYTIQSGAKKSTKNLSLQNKLLNLHSQIRK